MKKLPATARNMISVRVSAPKKGSARVANVGQILAKSQASCNIGEFALKHGLVSVVIVVRPSAKSLDLFNTTESTLRKGPVGVVIGSLSPQVFT